MFVRVSARLACLLLLAGLASCAKKGPPAATGLAFARPDDTRANLIATVAVPTFEGTVAEATTLGRRLELPFADADLRTMLVARLPLPPALAGITDRLDLRQPIGVAFFARPKAPTRAVLAGALPAGGSLASVADTLGTRGATNKDAVEVRRPDGTQVWLLARDGVLLAAETIDVLVAAGAHALAARQSKGDDVLATLHPEAMARAHGQELRDALDDARKRLAEDLRQGQGGRAPTPASVAAAEGILAPWLDRLAETEAIDVAFNVDPGKGLSLTTRALPRKGTTFAKEAGTRAPYRADPGLLTGQVPAAFIAAGTSPFLVRTYDVLFRTLADAGAKGARELTKPQQGLAALFTGASSTRVTPGRGGLSIALAAELRPGVGEVAAFDATSSFFGRPAFGALLEDLVGRTGPRWRWVREGDVGRAELAYPPQAPASVKRALRAMYGSETVVINTAASRGRLLATTGPEARAELDALAGAPATAATASGDLATALAESRGDDGLVFVDLMGFVRPGLEIAAAEDRGAAHMASMIGLIPGLSSLHLPLVVVWRGGDRLTTELRVPLSTMTRAASFLKPLLGLAGGAFSQ